MLGPILWLVALLVASWMLGHTDAIELGLLVTAACLPSNTGPQPADYKKKKKKKKKKNIANC